MKHAHHFTPWPDDAYIAIAQPDKMATSPDAKTIRPWLEKDRPSPPIPDQTRMAYYWMAMGISQLLK